SVAGNKIFVMGKDAKVQVFTSDGLLQASFYHPYAVRGRNVGVVAADEALIFGGDNGSMNQRIFFIQIVQLQQHSAIRALAQCTLEQLEQLKTIITYL